MAGLRESVRGRVGGRCEYCRLADAALSPGRTPFRGWALPALAELGGLFLLGWFWRRRAAYRPAQTGSGLLRPACPLPPLRPGNPYGESTTL
jgi:hypothetical protein